MLRAWTAAVLSLAIPVAALCAPLVHAHPDDHDGDHHGAPVVHAHITGHVAGHKGPRRNLSADAARTLTVRDDLHEGERAIALQVFVAVAPASFDLPVAAPSVVELPAPREAAAHPPVDVVHAHDPPHQAALPSRAPPAFLS